MTDWNAPAPERPPLIVDATLSQLETMPQERQLRNWLALLQGFPVETVAVGTVRHGRDWHQVERLAGAVEGLPNPPRLEFNLDYPACGASSLLSAPGLRWRTLASGDDRQANLHTILRHSSQVTMVLHEAVDLDPLELSRCVRACVAAGIGRVELLSRQGRPWLPGVEALVRFARGLVSPGPERPQFIWSSCDSAGLALAQAVSAWEAGVDLVRATFLGGFGSVPLEGLWTHLHLEGTLALPMTRIHELARYLEDELDFEVPSSQPIVGADAFRTAWGPTASAILSARRGGDPDLLEAACSSLPARWLGRTVDVCVGPGSGRTNVEDWLQAQGFEADAAVLQELVAHAQASPQVLSELELVDLLDYLKSEAATATG